MTWRNLLRVALDVLVPETETEEGERGEARSFDELDVVNYPTTKTESLERTLDRAESLLDDQLRTVADVHHRAIRTVRIEVVLVGATTSISQLTSNPVSTNFPLKASGALLIASIVVGIVTSSSSSPDYGPGPDYVRSNIESGNANDEVYLELLGGYSEAISYNRTVVNESTKYLFVTQFLLVASLVIGSIGVVVL